MPFDFKALAERAMTVEVGGEAVHLRLPTPEQKAAISGCIIAGTRKNEGETDEQAESQRWILQWSLASGLALHACVPSNPPMAAEEWQALAVMDEWTLKQAGLDPDEFRRLMDASRRLCGLGAMVDALEGAAADEGVTDNIADADEAAGNSPTS